MTTLLTNYRRILSQAPLPGGELESPSAFPELTLSSIQERIEKAKASLQGIVEKYLENSPDARALVERLVQQGYEGLRMAAENDEQALANSPGALTGLEAIVYANGFRPSFLIANDEVDFNSSPVGAWGDQLTANMPNLRGVLHRVGRIDVPGSTVGFVGAGFLVAENLLMTSRHVLHSSAELDSSGIWRFFDGAAIDFGHEWKGRSSVNHRRLKKVAFAGEMPMTFTDVDHDKLDLALIELEPAPKSLVDNFSLSINFQIDCCGPQTQIYIIGYSGSPHQSFHRPTLLDQLFQIQFGYKRLAPGLIIDSRSSANPWTLAHDATVLGNNSGSLVVAAGAEWQALGLHYGGSLGGSSENWAHRLSLTLDARDDQSKKTLREVLQNAGIHTPEDNSQPNSTLAPHVDRLRQDYLARALRIRNQPKWEWDSSQNLTAAPPSLAKNVDGALFREAEEAAALSGRFHPDQLLNWASDVEKKVAVLNSLAPSCQVETFANGLQWLLSPKRRTEVLQRLQKEKSLPSRLNPEATSKLPRTDRFGEMLREVLRDGKANSLARRSTEDLQQLSAVADIVGDLYFPGLQVDEIRRQLARGNFLQEYGVLLDEGFVGRTEALQQLRSFLKSSPPASTNLSTLLITGVGGAGKSTLIGKFAHEVFHKQLATIVILDLDRPGIDVADFEWMSLEIARQVGRQYPQSLELLRAARSRTRQGLADARETEVGSLQEMISNRRTHSGTILGAILDALQAAKASDRPLLLIFDTFEIAYRNEVHLLRLQEWLPQLAVQLSPVALRVIYSGRPAESAILGQNLTYLTLDELPANLAQQLLENQGLTPAIAQRLANSSVIPRRPLELKLLARAMRDETKASIQSLEDELRGAAASDSQRDGGSQNEVRERLKTGVIYRRVLNRIEDPIARQLAFPGLVLRYVSFELIQEVLSPVLQLDLSETDSSRVLAELASHSWLVERRGNGQYWHRGDLRRLMIQLISGKEAEEADSISRRAIEFFERRDESGHQEEVMYHRLRLIRKPEDGESVELSELGSVARALVANEDDLFSSARALLKLALNEHIPESDVVALPRKYLPLAYERTGAKLVEAEEFGKAVQLYRRGQQERLPIHWEAEWPNWEIETLFQTACWPELRELSPPGPLDLGIRDLLTRLFPSEVIGRLNATAKGIEENLMQLTGKELFGAKDNGTVVGRLIMVLVLLDRRDRLSSATWEHALSLAQSVAAGKKKTFSAFLESRIRLLRLAARFSGLVEIRLAPSILSLEPKWLDSASKRVRRDSVELSKLLSEVREVVRTVLKETQPTSQRLLSSVDAHYKYRKRWRDATLRLEPDDSRVQLLSRAPDIEFRTPCRFALMELYSTREDYHRLAEIIASVVPYKLDDLEPTTFADLLIADPEHGLAPHLELVDRIWKLGELMTRVESDRPNGNKLSNVLDAYQRWEAAVIQIIRNLA